MMMRELSVWILCLIQLYDLFGASFTAEGAVSFIFGPSNITANEGDRVVFNCSFIGSPGAPVWNINGLIFQLNRIPTAYSLINGFSSVVNQAGLAMNNSFYQCFIGDFKSSIGYLFVKPLIGQATSNMLTVTQTTAVVLSNLIPYTSISESEGSYILPIPTSIPKTPYFDPTAISFLVAPAVLIILLVTFVSLLIGIMILYNKRKKSRDHTLTVTSQEPNAEMNYNSNLNYVYELNKPIEMTHNDAYEKIEKSRLYHC